jgi:hypothetical protein
LINQEEIHRKSVSSKVKERIEAMNQLRDNFAVLPDKKQAWNDLYRLTLDYVGEIRISANHSLGRACIFKATKADREKDFRKALENALAFFT